MLAFAAARLSVMDDPLVLWRIGVLRPPGPEIRGGACISRLQTLWETVEAVKRYRAQTHRKQGSSELSHSCRRYVVLHA